MTAVEENVLVSLLLFFCPQFFCLLVEEFQWSGLARRRSVPRLRASAGLYSRFLTNSVRHGGC